MLAEHIRLVEENHNLIYGFLNRYKLNEDFYADAAIGLCKAAESYDETQGSTFAIYAYKCMFNECGKTIRKEKRNIQTISLETPVSNGEDINLESAILHDHSNINLDFVPYIQWFIDKMCLIDLKILLYRLQGDSYRDVSRKIGYSYQTVKDRLLKIGKAYKSKKRPYSRNDIDDCIECQNVKNQICALIAV